MLMSINNPWTGAKVIQFIYVIQVHDAPTCIRYLHTYTFPHANISTCMTTNTHDLMGLNSLAFSLPFMQQQLFDKLVKFFIIQSVIFQFF